MRGTSTVAASFQAPDLFDIGEDLTKMQVDTNVDEADVDSCQTGNLRINELSVFNAVILSTPAASGINCRLA